MSCRFSWRSKWNHSRFTGRVAAVLLQKAHQNSASQPTLRSFTVTKHPSFTSLVCSWITYTLCVCVCVCEQVEGYTHTKGVFSALSKASSLEMGFPEMISSVRPGMKLSGGPENRSSRACIMDSQRSNRRITACSMGETMGNSADTTTRGYMVTQWAILQTPQPGYMVTQWAVLRTPHPEVTWWHNGQFCRHHIQRLHGDTMGSFADTTTRGYMVTQWAVLQTSQPEVTWWHNGQFCRHQNRVILWNNG